MSKNAPSSSQKPRSRGGRRKSGGRRNNRPIRKPVSPSAKNALMAELMHGFTACPRCSFFISGYRARIGLAQLEEELAMMVARLSTDGRPTRIQGWLTLSWNREVRKLLEGAWGFELPHGTLHFEGRCEECGRAFVYEPSDVEEVIRPQAEKEDAVETESAEASETAELLAQLDHESTFSNISTDRLFTEWDAPSDPLTPIPRQLRIQLRPRIRYESEGEH